MQARFSKTFTKCYDKSTKKIQKAFDTRLRLFLKDPYNPLLRNHALSGKLMGYRSINVTGDWRALYTEEGDSIVIFDIMGTHSELYQ